MRPSRLRRWLVGSAFALAGLIFVVGALLVAGWQALRTDAGTAWLLSQVSGLKISGSRGSLQGGPFEAAQVEFRLRDAPVWVRIDGLSWRDLHWRWRPYAGAWTSIAIDGLRARRVEVHKVPSDKPSQAPTQLRLPLELEVRDAEVQALQIDDLPLVSDVRTALHLGADQGRLHRIDRLGLRWDKLQLQASGQVQAVAPMAVQAQAGLASLQLPGAHGRTAWQAQVQAGGTLPRLQLDGSLRSQNGPARLDLHGIATPFASWPIAALQAQMKALDLSALASGAPVTSLEGHARLQSTGLDQPAQVDLQLANASPGRWDEARLPLRQMQVDLRGQLNNRSRLELHAFDLQLGNGQRSAGRWQGSGQWAGDRLQLKSTISGLQPSELDRRLAAMTLSGPVSLDLQGLAANGTAPAHWLAALQAQLDGQLAAPRAPAVRVQLEGSAQATDTGPRIELHQLSASAGGARAKATASAQRQADGRWQVASRGDLSDFDPVPWWPGAEGSAWREGPHRLNGRWDVDLVWPAPRPTPAASPWHDLQGLRGRAELQLTDSRVAGVPVQGQLKLNADGRTPLASVAADLQASGNRLKLDGQLALADDGAADRWQVDAQAGTLAALAPLARLVPSLEAWAPKSGSFSLQAKAQGRWPALRSEGDARLGGLKAGTLSMTQAQAHWRFGGGVDAPLEMKATADGIALGHQQADHLRADLSGTGAAHKLLVEANTGARPPAWAETLSGAAAPRGTRLELQADGSWQPARDGGRWRGRVQRLHAGAGEGTAGKPWIVADGLQAELQLDGALNPTQARLEPGRLQLLGAAVRWTEMRWQAPAPGGAPRIDVQAEIEPLRVAPLLARLQPDFGWGGDLTMSGHVSLHSANAFNADVVVERIGGDLSVTDEGGTQILGLTDLRLGLVANNGIWHFTEALAGSTVGVLAGAQSMRLPPRAVWPAPDTPLEGLLELRVDKLDVWGPWTPPGWRLVGTLHVSATLGGRFGAPEYTGRLEGHGLGARNLLQGVNVTDGEVAIALRGPTAHIERFTAKAGDGTLALEGGASFGEKPRADFKLKAQRFQVLGRLDRRIVASGDAQATMQADAIKLDGRFVVDEGLIDFSRGNAPTLDDDVTVVRRPTASASAAASEAAAEPPPPPKPSRQVSAALQVDLGEHLRIRGRGLDAFLRGELKMTTPGGRLAVNGTVRTENGTYAAYGQKLEIERGLVSFSGPVENPRLDIVALRPNLDVRVGVSVAGTALKPRVRLFSDPDMSDADKLSWLVLGRAPEGLGRNDTALLQRAAMALLAGEGESTTDRVMNALGLDQFSVRSEGEGDVRSTVVTLGKQLSRRLYVGYERGVASTTGTWQLIYRIAQRFTLRAQAGEDAAVDLIWTWRWN